MKRLSLALLFIIGTSLTAGAQQKSEQTENSASPADKTVITLIQPSPSRPGWIINHKPLQLESMIEMQSDKPALTTGPRFVVVDGAVYVRMPGNNLFIPMPGGGASGCFTLDLPKRIERLKNLIERFPVKSESAPAIKQLEAYAV